jgi:hypothetical protein
MSIATVLCWVAFGFVIKTVNPETTNWLGFSLFYISLFLSLVGTSAIVGFVARFVFLRHELAFRAVKSAFRQSFFFSFLVVALLYFLAHNLFTWLNLIYLVLGLTALEFFLISYHHGKTVELNK